MKLGEEGIRSSTDMPFVLASHDSIYILFEKQSLTHFKTFIFLIGRMSVLSRYQSYQNLTVQVIITNLSVKVGEEGRSSLHMIKYLYSLRSELN